VFGGGLTVPGLPPRPPSVAPQPTKYYSKERYCETCEVRWTVQTANGEDQLCWSCGGQTEESP
jgi:hypothetical protein